MAHPLPPAGRPPLLRALAGIAAELAFVALLAVIALVIATATLLLQ